LPPIVLGQTLITCTLRPGETSLREPSRRPAIAFNGLGTGPDPDPTQGRVSMSSRCATKNDTPDRGRRPDGGHVSASVYDGHARKADCNKPQSAMGLPGKALGSDNRPMGVRTSAPPARAGASPVVRTRGGGAHGAPGCAHRSRFPPRRRPGGSGSSGSCSGGVDHALPRPPRSARIQTSLPSDGYSRIGGSRSGESREAERSKYDPARSRRALPPAAAAALLPWASRRSRGGSFARDRRRGIEQVFDCVAADAGLRGPARR